MPARALDEPDKRGAGLILLDGARIRAGHDRELDIHENPFGADVPVERVVWNMRNGQTSSFSKSEAHPVRTRQTDYRTVPSGTS
ncbi:Uncharacterised protein [Collinsella intestinalis]|nr:Uncharacterised protein [Collinsella intestinalis]